LKGTSPYELNMTYSCMKKAIERYKAINNVALIQHTMNKPPCFHFSTV